MQYARNIGRLAICCGAAGEMFCVTTARVGLAGGSLLMSLLVMDALWVSRCRA